MVWGVVQALLDQLHKTRVVATNVCLQCLNVLLTTLYLISGLKVPSIIESTGKKVAWEYLRMYIIWSTINSISWYLVEVLPVLW